MTEALRAAGAGVVASFCLEGGVLSGKYLSGAAAGLLDRLSPGDIARLRQIGAA